MIALVFINKMQKVKNHNVIETTLEIKPLFHVDTGLGIDGRVLIAVVNELTDSARCSHQTRAEFLWHDRVDGSIQVHLFC